MKFYCVTIQMKPSFQLYFHTVLFIQYVALTFESVDEILLCYYSNNKTSLALTETSLVILILTFETDCSAKSCGVTMQNLSHLFPSFD